MTMYMVDIPYLEIDHIRPPYTDVVTLTAQAGGEPAARQPELTFAGLLRLLRAEARLTQEELAEAAGLSPRSISDLERGVNLTARKATALLLAEALGLADPARTLFVAAARGRASASEAVAARDRSPSAPPFVATRALVRDVRVPPGDTEAPVDDAEVLPGDTRALARDVVCLLDHRPGLARLIDAITAIAANGDGGVLGIYVIGEWRGPAQRAAVASDPVSPARPGST